MYYSIRLLVAVVVGSNMNLEEDCCCMDQLNDVANKEDNSTNMNNYPSASSSPMFQCFNIQ